MTSRVLRPRKKSMHGDKEEYEEAEKLLDPPAGSGTAVALKAVDLDEAPAKVAGRPSSYQLWSYDDLPEWLQDNHFVRRGYRVNFSFKLCIESLFRLHNESWSIWTHLAGFLSFVALSFCTFGWFIKDYDSTDVFVFTVFLIGAQCQMLFSTVFHWFGCHSPKVYAWLAKLDYSGISMMIVGSYYPPMYYGFYCHSFWRTFYLVFISLFGVAGIAVGAIPIFATPRYRGTRAAFFLAFGFSAIVPLPHMIFYEGMNLFPMLWREALLGFLYVAGVFFYTSRFPEKCAPGSCDFSLGSHAIWHLFTIAAAFLQMHVCVLCYNYRMQNPCPA